MLTIRLGRTIPLRVRAPYVHMLGRTRGVFVDENFLTLY